MSDFVFSKYLLSFHFSEETLLMVLWHCVDSPYISSFILTYILAMSAKPFYPYMIT